MKTRYFIYSVWIHASAILFFGFAAYLVSLRATPVTPIRSRFGVEMVSTWIPHLSAPSSRIRENKDSARNARSESVHPTHAKLHSSSEGTPENPSPMALEMTPPPSEHRPVPKYPEIARRKMWEGTVLLQISTGTDGAVTEAAIAESSGYAVLDDSALSTVRSWRLRANLKNETLPMIYRLSPPKP